MGCWTHGRTGTRIYGRTAFRKMGYGNHDPRNDIHSRSKRLILGQMRHSDTHHLASTAQLHFSKRAPFLVRLYFFRSRNFLVRRHRMTPKRRNSARTLGRRGEAKSTDMRRASFWKMNSENHGSRNYTHKEYHLRLQPWCRDSSHAALLRQNVYSIRFPVSFRFKLYVVSGKTNI